MKENLIHFKIISKIFFCGTSFYERTIFSGGRQGGATTHLSSRGSWTGESRRRICGFGGGSGGTGAPADRPPAQPARLETTHAVNSTWKKIHWEFNINSLSPYGYWVAQSVCFSRRFMELISDDDTER